MGSVSVLGRPTASLSRKCPPSPLNSVFRRTVSCLTPIPVSREKEEVQDWWKDWDARTQAGRWRPKRWPTEARSRNIQNHCSTLKENLSTTQAIQSLHPVCRNQHPPSSSNTCWRCRYQWYRRCLKNITSQMKPETQLEQSKRDWLPLLKAVRTGNQ